MTVEVHVLPDCRQCTATTRCLDRDGVTYRRADARESIEFLRAHGITSAPGVIVTADDGTTIVWGGYRPDLIAKHITGITACTPPAIATPSAG